VTAPHVVAMGGGGFSMEPENLLLDRFVLSLTRSATPRVCFVYRVERTAGDGVSERPVRARHLGS
jgi:dipeptidase E